MGGRAVITRQHLDQRQTGWDRDVCQIHAVKQRQTHAWSHTQPIQYTCQCICLSTFSVVLKGHCGCLVISISLFFISLSFAPVPAISDFLIIQHITFNNSKSWWDANTVWEKLLQFLFQDYSLSLWINWLEIWSYFLADSVILNMIFFLFLIPWIVLCFHPHFTHIVLHLIPHSDVSNLLPQNSCNFSLSLPFVKVDSSLFLPDT